MFVLCLILGWVSGCWGFSGCLRFGFCLVFVYTYVWFSSWVSLLSDQFGVARFCCEFGLRVDWFGLLVGVGFDF